MSNQTPTSSVDERGLNEINRSLGRIEGQLTALSLALVGHAADAKTTNTRIDRIEARVNKWVGAAALVSAAAAVFGKYLFDKLVA